MSKRADTTAEKRGLTPKQDAVALLLAAGRSIAQAAKEAGVGERTIQSWNASIPAFRARVAELRAEIAARAVGRLAGALDAAIDTLAGLLGADCPPTVRCTASRGIIESF